MTIARPNHILLRAGRPSTLTKLCRKMNKHYFAFFKRGGRQDRMCFCHTVIFTSVLKQKKFDCIIVHSVHLTKINLDPASESNLL